MEEVLVRGRTLPEAYHRLSKHLICMGKSPSPTTTRSKECSMTILVEEPFAEPMMSKLFIGGYADLEQYRQEVLTDT